MALNLVVTTVKSESVFMPLLILSRWNLRIWENYIYMSMKAAMKQEQQRLIKNVLYEMETIYNKQE